MHAKCKRGTNGLFLGSCFLYGDWGAAVEARAGGQLLDDTAETCPPGEGGPCAARDEILCCHCCFPCPLSPEIQPRGLASDCPSQASRADLSSGVSVAERGRTVGRGDWV